MLGVRQDLPTYTRTRHPDRGALVFAAWVLELCAPAPRARMPGRCRCRPDLANCYRHSRDVCEIVVSLIPAEAIAPDGESLVRDYEGELAILSVGRLDTEKNPLLMVDVLERLEAASPGRWRLRVCGEGPAEEEIRRELAERGLSERCELLGYVSWGEDLQRVYSESHILLHISQDGGIPAGPDRGVRGGPPRCGDGCRRDRRRRRGRCAPRPAPRRGGSGGFARAHCCGRRRS